MTISQDDLCRKCDGEGKCECDECGHYGECGHCLGTGFNPDIIDVPAYAKAAYEFLGSKRATWQLEVNGIKAGRTCEDKSQVLADDFRIGQ